MDCKDMMIGDWVNEGLFNVKISSFDDTQLHFEYVDSAYADIRTASRYLAECKPIPLTKEILKANAFEVCYESCYQTKFNIWSFDEKTCVEYKISKQTEDYNHLKIFIDGGERVSIPIRYVHELQHALRLCGLNELADNFKV